MKSTAILTLVILMTWVSLAKASSCAGDLAAAQALFDMQEGRTAAEGPSLPETNLAHRQPTPGSIAQALASHNNDQTILQASSALNDARQADQAGDAATCESKLAEMRSILTKMP